MLYLDRQTRPNTTYAVNFCECYMFCYQHYRKLALKRVGQYLKGTSTKGLIINPSKGLCNIDCYPDADFVEMYNHWNPTDPSCVKSIAGYCINFANFPVLWKYKFHMKKALSTMESKVI